MSSLQTNPTQTDLRKIADAIRSHDRFVVTTHENPDGDALGSLVAMTLALRELGKDAVMYLFGEVPLPREYRFMALGDLVRTLPDDVSERVLVAVDAANESRLGPEHRQLLDAAPLVIDIDHHHDNSRFGDLNLIVADASSTGEILRDLLAELGVDLTPPIAEALYIAIVTDTGRFQYANTTAKALRLAAELVEAGADVHRVFQGVYENVSFAKLKLLARALENAQLLEGGRLVVSHLGEGRLRGSGGGGAFLGGHHRLPTRGRRLRDGRTDPRASDAERPSPARQLTDDRAGARRLGHRSQERGRGP